MKNFKLGVIGGGFMAKAILDGALKNKFLCAEQIVVSEPNVERAQVFRAQNITVAPNNTFVAQNCEYLFFAVKPQIFQSVAQELMGLDLPVVLTIMAGKTKSSVRSALKASNLAVARMMPNLPCAVGEGVTGVDCEGLTPLQKSFVLGLFSSVGRVVEVDESKLNAVTGISGSGPAYVYLFLRALVKAGVEQGLSEEQAKELALYTVKGGAKMVEEQPEKSLQELIDAVSSKGGTTVAALESFARDGFEDSVSRAVACAVKRAEELSQ